MGQKLGQHFLKDKNVLKRIVEALELKEDDVVLEVGAGHGELSREILVTNKKVKLIAVEKDKKLVDFLKKNFPSDSFPNFFILEGDILKFISSQKFFLHNKINKIVGNIPYYLTGYLLRKISGLKKKPSLVVFLLQKEVALRICAKSPRMNILAASVQFWSNPKILFFVKKGSFVPPPKVDSAVISLKAKKDFLFKSSFEEKAFFDFIRILFKQPRKTILNNLVAGGYLKERIISVFSSLNLKESFRPQDLNLEMILILMKKILKKNIC